MNWKKTKINLFLLNKQVVKMVRGSDIYETEDDSTSLFYLFIISKRTYNILKESLIALLICACGDLVAGIVLGRMDIFLETFPGLLVIIPGAIGMRGNIFWFFCIQIIHSITYWYNRS